MKSPDMLHPTVLYGALIGGLMLLVGCGVDPPSTTASNSDPAAPPKIQGVKPTLDSTLKLVAENSATTKCNIETLGGSSMEGVRPTVDVSKAVGVAGWYFNSASAVAAVATPEGGAPASGAPGEADGVGPADETDSAPSNPAPIGDAGLQLVLVSEDGSKHWLAAVPERTDRPDVAEVMKDPAFLNTGFAFDLDLSGFQPGYYSLHLSDKAHNATSVCGLGRGFAVE